MELSEEGFMDFKLAHQSKPPPSCLTSIATLLIGDHTMKAPKRYWVSLLSMFIFEKNNDFQALLLNETLKISSGLATDNPQTQ